MANFCTNCGSKLEDNYNYCVNCGTKIDKSDIKQPNSSSNYNLEKKKAKKELKRVVGGKILYNKTFHEKLLENGLDIIDTGKAIRQQVEKEIESGQIKSGGIEFRVNQLIAEYKIKNGEKQKKLKLIDEIFESPDIKSEIVKNRIDERYIISIKDSLKNKLIDKKENLSEYEIKDYIKTELMKATNEMEKARIAKEKEMSRKKIEMNKMNHGGYCGFGCKHYYEEFLDSGGAIVGDFDSDGYVEYYCNLGHSVVHGCFCKYYE